MAFSSRLSSCIRVVVQLWDGVWSLVPARRRGGARRGAQRFGLTLRRRHTRPFVWLRARCYWDAWARSGVYCLISDGERGSSSGASAASLFGLPSMRLQGILSGPGV